MTTAYVDQTTVLNRFSETVRDGNKEILVATPWEPSLANTLENMRPKASISRILITIKANQPANQGDLDKLNLLKLDGAQIRCYPSLTEKMLIVDNCKVLVGSEDITASDLGIDRAPSKECGVISDEDHLIGRAKEKYEGMWEKGVDYELGDLRVENNRIAFSGKGDGKMSGEWGEYGYL